MIPSPLLASVEPSLQYDPGKHIACGECFVARSMTDWPTAHKAITAGIGLPDRACRAVIRVSGRDHRTVLDELCTNRVAELNPGAGVDSYLLDDEGRVRFDVSLYADAEATLICAAREAAAPLVQYLRASAPETTIDDTTAEFGRFALMGPEAPLVLAECGLPNAGSMAHGDHAMTEITLEQVRVMRSNFAGPLGFDLVTPAEWFNMILAAVCSIGVKLQLQVYPVGADATTFTARMAGRVDLPPSLSGMIYPQELRQGARTVDWEKRRFRGKEAARRAASQEAKNHSSPAMPL